MLLHTPQAPDTRDAFGRGEHARRRPRAVGRPSSSPTGAGRSVLDRGGDVGAVIGVLRSLEPLDREVLVLRYRDRLSIARIAALTETTVGSVHQRLRRGALAVEDGAGPSGTIDLGGRAAADDDDATHEDLRLGITPQLAARIRAAVVADPSTLSTPGRRPRRRLVAEEWLRRRLPQLTALGGIGAAGLLAAVAIAGG